MWARCGRRQPSAACAVSRANASGVSKSQKGAHAVPGASATAAVTSPWPSTPATSLTTRVRLSWCRATTPSASTATPTRRPRWPRCAPTGVHLGRSTSSGREVCGRYPPRRVPFWQRTGLLNAQRGRKSFRSPLQWHAGASQPFRSLDSRRARMLTVQKSPSVPAGNLVSSRALFAAVGLGAVCQTVLAPCVSLS